MQDEKDSIKNSGPKEFETIFNNEGKKNACTDATSVFRDGDFVCLNTTRSDCDELTGVFKEKSNMAETCSDMDCNGIVKFQLYANVSDDQTITNIQEVQCLNNNNNKSTGASQALTTNTNEKKENIPLGNPRTVHVKDNLNKNDIECDFDAQEQENRIEPTRVNTIRENSTNSVTAKTDSVICGIPSEIPFRPLAKILYNIGLDLTSERVCEEIDSQMQTKSPLSDAERKQMSLLNSSKMKLQLRNEEYKFSSRMCRCGFQSESRIVLAFHKQFGGVSFKQGSCCLCSFLAKNSYCFTRHMKRRHGIKALTQMKSAQHQCPFCPFENNYQLRFDAHVARCQKLFNLDINLYPCRMDCDVPLFVKTNALQGKPLVNQFQSCVASYSFVSQTTKPSLVSFASSLPPTHVVVTPSLIPTLRQASLNSVQPKTQDHFACLLVPSSAPPSLKSIMTTAQPVLQPAVNKNCLSTNLMIPPLQTRLALCNPLTHSSSQVSQKHLTVASLIAQSVPKSQEATSVALNQIRPEKHPVAPSTMAANSFQSQAILSFPKVVGQQIQTSGSSTQLIQVGNQLYTLVQHQGNTILTPLILPSPVLPLASSLILNCPPETSNKSAGFEVIPKTNNLLQPSSEVGSLCTPSPVINKGPSSDAWLQSTSSRNSPSCSLPICEICDGFIKDHQSLAVHFRIAHRITLENQSCFIPSQPCALCKQSFYTLSGLLRHYNMTHVNDSKLLRPMAHCSICKKVNMKSVVKHLSTHHHAQMLLSLHFKHCGICSLSMDDAMQFEKHMLALHGDLFADRNILLATIAASTQVNMGNTCNNTVQQISNNTDAVKACYICKTCHMSFRTAKGYSDHVTAKHMQQCVRCKLSFNTVVALRRHFCTAHAGEQETCPLCLKTVPKGQQFICHVKRLHLKECFVRIERLPKVKSKKIMVMETAINSTISGRHCRKTSHLNLQQITQTLNKEERHLLRSCKKSNCRS